MRKMDDRTVVELSAQEIKERSKVNLKEHEAIGALVKAVRGLPNTLCADIDEEGLIIRKRITKGCAVPVARVRRKSLTF